MKSILILPIIYSFNSLIRFDLTQFIINDMWFSESIWLFEFEDHWRSMRQKKEREKTISLLAMEKWRNWFSINKPANDENEIIKWQSKLLALQIYDDNIKRNAFAFYEQLIGSYFNMFSQIDKCRVSFTLCWITKLFSLSFFFHLSFCL